MSLHRARLKAWEEMPEDFKCCQDKKNFLDTQKDIVVIIDNSKTFPAPVVKCVYCHSLCQGMKDVMIVYSSTAKTVHGESPELVSFDLLDIDESPLTEEELRAYTTSRT